MTSFFSPLRLISAPFAVVMHGRNRSHEQSQDGNESSHGAPSEGEQSLIEALKVFVKVSRLHVPRVAHLMGVGEATLSKWLKGTTRPTRRKMLVIGSFLRHGRK